MTGEAGIGKTTLVDAFLDRVGPDVWRAREQCIAHYGAGEAYLPVLDALSRLARQAGAEPLAACLRRHAPSWLAQLPALTSDPEGPVAPPHAGAGPERMLRELAEALEALTAERALILALEDLHWSDSATLDLITWLALRQESARLLVLGTYRPVDVIVSDHPLQGLKQDLVRRGRCLELPLELLAPTEAAQHLAARFGPDSPALDDLARMLHRRTDGQPLFVVTLVDALVQAGFLASGSDGRNVRQGIDSGSSEDSPRADRAASGAARRRGSRGARRGQRCGGRGIGRGHRRRGRR